MVVDLYAANSHVIVLTDLGEVYCWGRNDQRQLGLGEDVGKEGKPEPVMVSQLEGKSFCGVACGTAQVRNEEQAGPGQRKCAILF